MVAMARQPFGPGLFARIPALSLGRGRTSIPRSSLACAQTASGAGHVEAVSRLCATSHGRAVCRSGAQCAFPSLKTEFVMRPTVLAALLVFSFPAVPAMAAPSGSQAVPAYVTAAINDPARAADHHDDARRQIAAVMTFAQVKPGDTVVELVPASGYWTRVFSAIVGPKGHVYTVWPD